MDPLRLFLHDLAEKEQAQPSLRSRNLTEEERVLAMSKSLLNWLTHKNFEKVKDQLVRTIRATPSACILKSLVSSVFDMAVAEDSFSLFGHLCAKLSFEIPPVPSDESFGEHITFKRLLLNKCQVEFEKANSVTERLLLGHDDKALRLRLMRSVLLVAELFKRRVVAGTTCLWIIQVLMEPTCPPERNIEAIYQFLSSIDKEVDTGPTFRWLFDAHSKRLENLIQNPLLSPRSRNMILKLKHLRANSLVEAKIRVRCPLGVDNNQDLRYRAAATTPNDIFASYRTGELEPELSAEVDNLQTTQSMEDADVNVHQKLDKALEKLRLSTQETCKEHFMRVAAEKDATAAIHKAGESEIKCKSELRLRKETEKLLTREREELEHVKLLLESYKIDRDNMSLQAEVLESKYNDELRVRKETEDALAREREELEMMKELFQSYKKERDNMHLQTELWEGKYNDELRLRKETEDGLAREREELDKMKQQLETYKEEQHNMHLQAGVLQIKYNDESRLRKATEVALARERDEVEKVKQLLETYKEERDNMQLERDNALRIAKDLEKKQAEYEMPSSFFCPITQDVMRDPHVAADGFTYEAEAIRRWLDGGHNTSPMTNLRLPHRALVPNHSLRSAIQDWPQHEH